MFSDCRPRRRRHPERGLTVPGEWGAEVPVQPRRACRPHARLAAHPRRAERLLASPRPARMDGWGASNANTSEADTQAQHNVPPDQ